MEELHKSQRKTPLFSNLAPPDLARLGGISILGNQIRILKADAFFGALALYHSIGTRPGGYPLQSFHSPV
jgi:hypothetical protein